MSDPSDITELHMSEYCPTCSGLRSCAYLIAVGRFGVTLPESCSTNAACRHDLAQLVGASHAAETGIHGGELL